MNWSCTFGIHDWTHRELRGATVKRKRSCNRCDKEQILISPTSNSFDFYWADSDEVDFN
jgi:hypothetical protein